MHAIYEQITVAGPEIVGVRLTAAACAHGLALALPEKVELARPTGVRHSSAHRRPVVHHIEVVGRRDWLRLLREVG